MIRIVAIGEPLVELTQSDAEPGAFRKGLGGDTLNTSVYLARLLGPGAVRYVTRLGTDPLSDWILSEIQQEGIDASCIARSPGKAPGLSLIECAPDGERAFTYWRAQSAARTLLQASPREHTAIANAPALFVSAVTLAVISPDARDQLMGYMTRLKDEGRDVYLDLNFRPALWDSVDLARSEIARAVRASTLALPSLDDVSALWGTDDPDRAGQILVALGASAVLLKTGGGPVYATGPQGAQCFPLKRIEAPTDTTGAGDSFNAAFIAARLSGADLPAAIAQGHALASQVVRCPGAIIPSSRMPSMPLVAQR